MKSTPKSSEVGHDCSKASLTLLWHFSGTAFQRPWYFCGTAVVLFWHCSSIAVVLKQLNATTTFNQTRYAALSSASEMGPDWVGPFLAPYQQLTFRECIVSLCVMCV